MDNQKKTKEYLLHPYKVWTKIDSIKSRIKVKILCMLIECGELNVGDISDRIAESQSCVSQAVLALYADDIVERREEHPFRYYSVSDCNKKDLSSIFNNLINL